MRTILRSTILISLLAASTSGGAEPLTLPHSTGKFYFDHVEFGQSHPLASVHVAVSAKNLAGEAIELEKIVPRETSGVSVHFKPGLVPPGESRAIDVDLVLGEEIGRVAYYFDVYAKGQPVPVDGFVVRGFADWIVSAEGTDIEFGTFDVRKAVKKIVRIETRPGAAVKLVSVDKPSAYFDAQITQDGSALQLISKSDAPWSSFDEQLLVNTDNALQPKVAFRLRGQARGIVVPSSDPVDFGLLREGQTAELAVVLNDVTGKSLEIGKVVSKSRMSVNTSLSECIPLNPSCRLLKITYPPMTMKGTTGGTINVELPTYKQNLTIRFGAIGIGKDTQIRSLEDDFKAAQEAPKSISSVLQTSVAKLPKANPHPAQMAAAKGTGPLLKWQVANEYDIYGYEIYRSNSEAGPFGRISNEILLRLEGDPEVGSAYQWRDTSAKHGETYWYYINIVYNRGKKQQFTTPQKVVAK